MKKNKILAIAAIDYTALDVTRLVITGSIARSANLPVFSLLRGRF